MRSFHYRKISAKSRGISKKLSLLQKEDFPEIQFHFSSRQIKVILSLTLGLSAIQIKVYHLDCTYIFDRIYWAKLLGTSFSLFYTIAHYSMIQAPYFKATAWLIAVTKTFLHSMSHLEKILVQPWINQATLCILLTRAGNFPTFKGIP